MNNDFFETNRKYVVLDDFIGFSKIFHKGEVLTFKSESYSWYDDCYGYEFIDSDGNSKTACSEEKNEASFLAHFRKLDT